MEQGKHLAAIMRRQFHKNLLNAPCLASPMTDCVWRTPRRIRLGDGCYGVAGSRSANLLPLVLVTWSAFSSGNPIVPPRLFAAWFGAVLTTRDSERRHLGFQVA